MFLLLGPFFINWTGFRSTIEEFTEQTLGHPVTVLGDADIRLLPSPRLTFSDIRVGPTEDPLIEIKSLSVVAELPPLLKGELKIRELILTEPDLRLGVDEYGQLDWFIKQEQNSAINPSLIVLDKIQINDGKINITDARSSNTYSVENLNFVGSADSIDGPFRANGQLLLANMYHSISLKTGKVDDLGRINLVALVSPENDLIEIEIKGDFFNENRTPKFEGDFKLTSIIPKDQNVEINLPSWNAEGKINLDSTKVDIDEIQIDYGLRDRVINFQGNIFGNFGLNSKFDVNLDSSQIDLDRLFGQGPNDPISAQFAIKKLTSLANSLPNPSAIGKIEFSSPSILVNGNIIQNVEIETSTTSSGWKVEKLLANLPGETNLSSNGEFIFGTATHYIGDIEIQSMQPTYLLSWWQDTAVGNALELETIDIVSKVGISPKKVELSQINGQLGQDQISGEIAWEIYKEDSRQKISASLALDQFELDQILTLSRILQNSNESPKTESIYEVLPTDLDLNLNLKHLDFDGIVATNVLAQLKYLNGELTIENLSSPNVVGSKVQIQGAISKLNSLNNGAFSVNIDSSDISGLFNSIQSKFPENKLVQSVQDRGKLFSPISITASYFGDSSSESIKKELNVRGVIANSEILSQFKLVGESEDWREINWMQRFN